MDKEVKKISGCSDCPACQYNDMSGGFSCKLVSHQYNFIKETKYINPITPDWCPLKTKDVILTMNKS